MKESSEFTKCKFPKLYFDIHEVADTTIHMTFVLRREQTNDSLKMIFYKLKPSAERKTKTYSETTYR